jgi:hypothetical protein
MNREGRWLINEVVINGKYATLAQLVEQLICNQ